MSQHPRVRTVLYMAILGPLFGWLAVVGLLVATRPFKPGGDVLMWPALLLTLPFGYLIGLLPALAAGFLQLALNAGSLGPIRRSGWYPVVSAALAGAVCCSPALAWVGLQVFWIVAVGAMAGAVSVYVERRSRLPALDHSLPALAAVIAMVCLAMLAAVF